MSLILISPPSGAPISLDEIKAHLRVTHNDEDALIAAVANTAARAIEARTGLALSAQNWRIALDVPPRGDFALPISPVISVDAVTVVNRDGITEIVPIDSYVFAPGSAARLRAVKAWPAL